MPENGAEPNGAKRWPLTEAQRRFFARHAQSAREIESAMRGALQMLVDEKGIAGKVRLSEDFAEMIEET
jgi:hypothetical protein